MDFFSNTSNLMLIALAVLSGTLLAWPKLARGQSALNATEATLLINQRHARIIDIRPYTEFIAGHLPQAKSIPLKELSTEVNNLRYDKKKPILVTCHTGTRAPQAVKVLRNAGFSEAFYLEEGIASWQKANLPLTKQGR